MNDTLTTIQPPTTRKFPHGATIHTNPVTVVDAPQTRRTYSCRTWGDIHDIDLPPQTYFLGDAMALGRLHVIFGQGGLGKSRLSLNIARNQVLGIPFANMSTGDKPLRHLFIGSENNLHRLQKDIRLMSRAVADEKALVLRKNIVLTTLEDPMDSSIGLDDPRNVQRWRETIAEHKPDVLWVDPWGDIRIGDSVKDEDARETVQTLMALVRSGGRNAGVVVLAHARTGVKNILQAFGYDAANFGKDSKALYSCARSVFNLAPGSEDETPPLVMVHAKSNDGLRVKPFALRLDPETHLYDRDPNFDFEAWASELDGRSKGKANSTPAVSMDKVLEMIVKHGVDTTTGIKTMLRGKKVNRDVADDYVKKLKYDGKLAEYKPSKKNAPTYIGLPDAIEAKRKKDEGAS